MNNNEDEVNDLTTTWQCKRKSNVPSSAVGGITSKCQHLLARGAQPMFNTQENAVDLQKLGSVLNIGEDAVKT